MNKNRLLALAVSAIVLVAVIAGLVLAGSPAQERTRRADEQRIMDLQNLSYAIESYARDNGMLPASLEDAARQPNTYVARITDPETNAPYHYRITGSTQYQLCATFEAPTPRTPNKSDVPPELSFWAHSAGETCYELNVESPAEDLKPILLQQP